MKTLRTLALAATLSLGLAACGGGGDASSSEPADTSSAPSGGTTLTITAPVDAANIGFTEKELSTAADAAFSIVFKNDDAGIPHNVQVFEGTDTTAAAVFAPADNAQINGVAETTYAIPALAAGTYTYNCFSHPATMVGTLTVG